MHDPIIKALETAGNVLSVGAQRCSDGAQHTLRKWFWVTEADKIEAQQRAIAGGLCLFGAWVCAALVEGQRLYEEELDNEQKDKLDDD